MRARTGGFAVAGAVTLAVAAQCLLANGEPAPPLALLAPPPAQMTPHVVSAAADGTRAPAQLAPPVAAPTSTAAAAFAATTWSICVRNEVGAPVPGVTVGFARTSAAVAPRAAITCTLPRDPRAIDLATEVECSGRAVQTDDAGRCQLAALPDESLLVARAPGVYGELRLGPGRAADSPVEIIVHADCTLVLQTVDANGRAIGDVAIGFEHAVAAVDGAITPRTPYWLGHTDANGQLVVRHLLRWRQHRDAPRVRLRALLAGADDVVVDVDLDRRAEQHARLVLPAMGRLQVVVFDPHHQPLAKAEVEVQNLHRGRTDANGRVLFPQVAAGANLEVTARAKGRTTSALVSGPLAGGVTSVTLHLNAPVVTIVGRLLAASGRASATCNLQLRSTKALFDAVTSATTAEGRFEFVLPAHLATLPLQGQLDLLSRDDQLLGEQAALPAITLQIGDNDVGDVQLATPAVLVAGHIAGAPAACTCQFRLEAEGPDGWSPYELFDVAPTVDGAFELRGPRPAQRLRLYVDVHGFAPIGPLPFTAGDRGLVVTPELGGCLSVRLRAPHPRLVRVVRASAGTDGLACRPTMRRDGAHWVYTWSSLPQGSYRLEVSGNTGALPDYVVTDIYVFPGTVVDDARLRPELSLPG